MELATLIGIFIFSLVALVKGADWVLDGAKKMGLAFGIPPFVVGVLIVGFGTSAPELVSSIAGMLQGATEIPVANATGSNIANVLLVVGAAAIAARGTLAATRNLIDLELPLLVLVTLFFYGTAFDGVITFYESLFLLAGFVVYILYSLFHRDGTESLSPLEKKPKVTLLDVVMLIVGFVLLVGGASYLIDSVIGLSEMIGISVGVITILAVAIGTSLPELIVSVKAALSGHAELAIGNVFGSNIFNLLMVVGVSGLFGVQQLDVATTTIALPALLAVTLFFVISGISKKIHVWEGAFYLLAYALFTAKLFGWV